MTLRTFALIAVLLPLPVLRAKDNELKRKIAAIAADAQGKVAVSCSIVDCDWNAEAKAPMQSVFKFPLVLATLHRVDEGKLTLDQMVRFLPEDRILPKTYSPLQDRYPQANVEIPLRELLEKAVSLSDNAATEVLLRLVGGPEVVHRYIHGIGIEGFQLRDGEAGLHRDDTLQYRNWLQPKAAVSLLNKFGERRLLKPPTQQLIETWMRESPTGMKRIRGLLPQGTELLHKTGTSGVRSGLAAATNDMGLIRLPDGRMLAIAVFVTDSRADEPTRESVIARIAKAAYDAAIHQKP